MFGAWVLAGDEYGRQQRRCLQLRPLGIGSAHLCKAMRQFKEDEHKESQEPQPVRLPLKEANAPETAESTPWLPTRKDLDQDRHRHV